MSEVAPEQVAAGARKPRGRRRRNYRSSDSSQASEEPSEQADGRRLQLPLGSLLPLVPRTVRCPGRMSVPKQMQGSKVYKDETVREPLLYVLVLQGECDSVLSSWYRTELAAPAHVDMLTHEWPGHGVREGEPLMTSLQGLGDDAFETFQEAMATGHFIIVGDSVGALLMTYVCERAQRELGVHPRAAIALERGPPHLPIFSAVGYQMLTTNPDAWLSVWMPNIHRLYIEGRVSEAAHKRWITDMRVETAAPPLAKGFYRFPCRLTALLASNPFQSPVPEARAQLTRCGSGHSFEGKEYDQWRDWAEELLVVHVRADHENIQCSEAFREVLWSEVDRVLRFDD